MKTTVTVEGLRELDEALGELSKATARNVLRRVGVKALEPVAEDYRNSVRRRSNALANSAGVGTKLTRRQAALHRSDIRRGLSDDNFVEVFAGPGGLPQAITEEFGTVDQAPQGDLRASWDSNKNGVLNTVASELGSEIEKARQRAARRAARQAARGG